MQAVSRASDRGAKRGCARLFSTLRSEIATRIAVPGVWPCVLGGLLSLLSALFVQPIFDEPKNWGIQDWDQHLFYHGVPRMTLLEHGELPLWNPYHGGGLPGLANPQSPFLSPAFLCVLVFGVVVGIKVEIWIHWLIGLTGGYLLGRDFGLARPSSLVVAAVYMLSGLHVLAITAGMTTFLPAAYLPWTVWLYRRGTEDGRAALGAGALLAITFFGGGAHLVLLTFVFLLLYTAAEVTFGGASLRVWSRTFATTAVSAACLGAVKLLPSAALLRRFPRVEDAYSGYSLESLAFALLHADQRLSGPAPGSEAGLLRGMSWGLDENGMYIGPGIALLIVIGVVTRLRRHKALAASSVALLWLMLGNRAPLSLWALLHELPVFEGMRVAQRFRFPFMLCAALFAGVGFELVQRWTWRLRSQRVGALAAASVFLAALVPLFGNGRAFGEAFSIPPLTVERSDQFRQARKLLTYDSRGWKSDASPGALSSWSALYPALLSNLGTIDAYEPILDRFVSPALASDAPAYRGEVFFDRGERRCSLVSWSPNRWVIDVDAGEPGVVVVNQNYFEGWHTNANTVIDHGGLIGLPIDAGRQRVTLRYLPQSFLVGAVVSMLAWALVVYSLFRPPAWLTRAAP
jgi:hypothetical protein